MAFQVAQDAVLYCFTAVLADTNAATTRCLNLRIVRVRDTSAGKSQSHHSNVRAAMGQAACQAVL